MTHYNSEDFKSVVNYLKEKGKISRAISYCNGIIYGVNMFAKSEQTGFELKAKAVADKERYLEQMDALKKAIEPHLNQYGRQMKFVRKHEVDGNKI